jgi:hypothetical protein
MQMAIFNGKKTYGGSGKDDANSIQQTSDGGYIVAGWTRSFGSVGSNDVWVLKLDSNGNIPGCSVEGSSNATVKTTNVSGVDSSAVVTNTSVTPWYKQCCCKKYICITNADLLL